MVAGCLLVVYVCSSFGITPTMEKLYHKGVMRTKVDDCQFVCIAQADYYRILHQVRRFSICFYQLGLNFTHAGYVCCRVRRTHTE